MYGSSLAELAETLKAQDAVDLGVQGIIPADPDVKTGMDMRAALSVKDIAGLDELSVRPLCSEALGIGITAVLGGAHSLFMREELKI